MMDIDNAISVIINGVIVHDRENGTELVRSRFGLATVLFSLGSQKDSGRFETNPLRRLHWVYEG
jgi:hypothetical protein